MKIAFYLFFVILAVFAYLDRSNIGQGIVWIANPANSQTVSGIAGIFSATIALVNLFAVIYFFRVNINEKQKDDARKNRRFWLHQFIIASNFEEIGFFFDKNIEIVEEATRLVSTKGTMNAMEYENAVQQLFGAYTDARISINERFCDHIHAIENDLGIQLDEYLSKCQDEFNEYLERYSGVNQNHTKEGFRKLVLTQKQKMIRILHSFDNGI